MTLPDATKVVVLLQNEQVDWGGVVRHIYLIRTTLGALAVKFNVAGPRKNYNGGEVSQKPFVGDAFALLARQQCGQRPAERKGNGADDDDHYTEWEQETVPCPNADEPKQCIVRGHLPLSRRNVPRQKVPRIWGLGRETSGKGVSGDSLHTVGNKVGDVAELKGLIHVIVRDANRALDELLLPDARAELELGIDASDTRDVRVWFIFKRSGIAQVRTVGDAGDDAEAPDIDATKEGDVAELEHLEWRGVGCDWSRRREWERREHERGERTDAGKSEGVGGERVCGGEKMGVVEIERGGFCLETRLYFMRNLECLCSI